MAQRKQQKDVITRLAETGEEALHKLADLPGAPRFIEAANALRDRVDDLAKRVRSLDPLERRVAELERRLDQLTKAKPTGTARRAAAPRAAAAKRTRTTSTRARKTGSK